MHVLDNASFAAVTPPWLRNAPDLPRLWGRPHLCPLPAPQPAPKSRRPYQEKSWVKDIGCAIEFQKRHLKAKKGSSPTQRWTKRTPKNEYASRLRLVTPPPPLLLPPPLPLPLRHVLLRRHPTHRRHTRLRLFAAFCHSAAEFYVSFGQGYATLSLL